MNSISSNTRALRANEDDVLRTTRGRISAPRLTPFVLKVIGAVAAVAVLAVIGARAGAHTEPTDDPNGAASVLPPAAPSPTPTSNSTSVAAADAGPAEGPGLLADGRVILNAATEEDLQKLPGIGPSRARAILALRQRLAKFRAVEDLLRVKGIGRKTLRRIRPNVVLDRPPDDAGVKMIARE